MFVHFLARGVSGCVSLIPPSSHIRIHGIALLVNFFFALPAVYAIDTFGRRKLLLTTFPCMAACLLITGFAFYIDPIAHPTARLGTIIFGIYFFCCFYS